MNWFKTFRSVPLMLQIPLVLQVLLPIVVAILLFRHGNGAVGRAWLLVEWVSLMYVYVVIYSQQRVDYINQIWQEFFNRHFKTDLLTNTETVIETQDITNEPNPAHDVVQV